MVPWMQRRGQKTPAGLTLPRFMALAGQTKPCLVHQGHNGYVLLKAVSQLSLGTAVVLSYFLVMVKVGAGT